MLTGSVSLGNDSVTVLVKILRDTGASQTLILKSVLPFDQRSSVQVSVLLKGFKSESAPYPLHRVHLNCGLASVEFEMALVLFCLLLA